MASERVDRQSLRQARDFEALAKAREARTNVEDDALLARALARLLPPVDLVLVEGWKDERLPRIEVHRRAVGRSFACARSRGFIAVVTDEPPPRDRKSVV